MFKTSICQLESLNERGFIVVDEYQEHWGSRYLCFRRCNRWKELTPVAIKADEPCLNDFNGKTDAKMDYLTIPTVVFSHPAIGTVGLTEISRLTEQKYPCLCYLASHPCIQLLPSTANRPSLKLITAGEDEKVVGLHGIGYGVDVDDSRFHCCLSKWALLRLTFDATVVIHLTGLKIRDYSKNSKSEEVCVFQPATIL